ncbi:MAG TPA: hypothetical protein VJ738_04630 [Steroidobacteraceae bacterium]|nr:hypothetical protein [Steroidobacteraceae bacterium]
MKPTKPPRQVNVLIDWDNVHPLWKRRGVKHVVSESLAVAKLPAYDGLSRIRVRLYGGWFSEAAVSRRAQELSAEIPKSFPSTEGGGTGARAIVDVELAKGIAQDPRTIFTHTYRERSLAGNLKSSSTPFIGCANTTACRMIDFARAINEYKCLHTACTVSLDDILTRTEQKLVDAMMILDIVYYSRFPSRDVIVVSADEDLVPAIHTGLLSGGVIHHICPIPGRAPSPHYSHTLTTTAYRTAAFRSVI